MKILLIEDDTRIAEFVRKGLKQEGFVVEHAVNGQTGLDQAVTEEYDLFVVDVMLPGKNGFQVVEEMRGTGIDAPVLFLSAKGAVEDRVEGLRRGGDDYLTKPFAFSELVARIQALLRRTSKQSEPMSHKVGDLEVDLFRRKVFRAGKEIELQPLEYMLLAYLVRNAGRVVSKTMIMEHVWEYNFDPQTNIVEARVCRLRDKIDRPFDSNLIRTIRGFGYVLEAPE